MKYTKTLRRTFSTHSVLSLAVFIVFSVACDNTNSNSNSATQTSNSQGTTASSNSPSGTTNVAAIPSTTRTESSLTKPTIAITEVPTKGAGETEVQTIAGTVGGVKIS